MQYRQGDVLLVKVEKLPAKKIKIEREKGRIVLAHGEATGHAHAVDHPNAKFWEAGDDRYLEIPEPTELRHEEHGFIPLAPGVYQVIRQMEYDPDAMEGHHFVGD
jgi:hypothetical protein